MAATQHRRAWTWSYTTLGVVLGFLLPCTATLIYLALGQRAVTFGSIIAAHRLTPLLWLVALSPVVLGLMAHAIGRRQDDAVLLTHELEKRIRQVSDANRALADEIGVKAELEEQLRHSQKLEAVGRLAGGVAHDFNNLLTAIIGYSDLLMVELGPHDPKREYAEQIRGAGDRAAALVQQLLGFSRKQMVSPRVVDLNAVVADSRKLLERVIGEDVRLDVIDADRPLHAFIDPVQIDQVLVNLVVNARDAMPDGGTVTLRLAESKVTEADCRSRSEAKPGDYCLLEVSDTGAGMDQTTIEKIFEPFFTTKDKSKGTGLGLATVYGIAKQNGGFVEVFSRLGDGATFKVHLPLKSAALEESKPASCSSPMGGRECILLVEDNEVVRALASKTLRDRGYEVLEAMHAGEAERIWILHKEHVDLLVTDIIMPGRDGKQLSEILRRDRPDMKVLFMSGYDDELLSQHDVFDDKPEFIPKPFTVDGLAGKIRQVLDSHAAPVAERPLRSGSDISEWAGTE
ncbi:MAG: ATP-binding protein [Candidatus Eisenbacteria bacterium]